MHACTISLKIYKVLKISVRPNPCAIFSKCMGFNVIKYDIPVSHEGHKCHETDDISTFLLLT